MMLVDGGLELLPDDDCWSLLEGGVIGRVGVSIEALPVILPVNYAVVDRAIYFCTAPGTKLRAAAREAVVAFEVDDFDPVLHTGWSVLAVGEAREVQDPARLVDVLRKGGGPWADGARAHLIRIAPAFVSGRRIVSAADARYAGVTMDWRA